MKFWHKLFLTLAFLIAAVYLFGVLAKFDYLMALKEHGKLGMFFVSFVASSVFFVFSSEVVVAAATKFIPAGDIFVYATLGSTLGAVVNYFVGLKGLRFFLDSGSKEEERAVNWFSRWGPGIVFFAASIPFVGDALTVVAGMLKMSFPKFLVFSLAGRAVKMLALIFFGRSLLSVLGA